MTVVADGEKERAQQFLQHLRTGFRVRELETKVVVSDSPLDSILSEARLGYGLMVLGATQTDDEETLFNPVIDQLVRLSPCTVMVARGEVDESEWRPSTILVPTNGTIAARRAAETAFAIAQAEGDDCRVTVLHVASTEWREGAGTAATRHGQRDELAADMVGHLAEIGEGLGVPVDTVVRYGDDPSEKILKEAASSGAGLIIVGTDLRPGARRLHLGREVERILRGANCPVLVVNATDGT